MCVYTLEPFFATKRQRSTEREEGGVQKRRTREREICVHTQLSIPPPPPQHQYTEDSYLPFFASSYLVQSIDNKKLFFLGYVQEMLIVLLNGIIDASSHYRASSASRAPRISRPPPPLLLLLLRCCCCWCLLRRAWGGVARGTFSHCSKLSFALKIEGMRKFNKDQTSTISF